MTGTQDRAKWVFGNEQDDDTYRKACEGKEKFLRKFGDDTAAVYHLASADVPVISQALGVRNLVLYHTEDKNLADRRRLYIAEGRRVFSGNLFVPDDLETIDL